MKDQNNKVKCNMKMNSKQIDLEPFPKELPSEYADRLGIFYTASVTEEYKKGLGQFFTPLNISHFMSRYSEKSIDRVKILDPGCGVGILSASLAEEIISKNKEIKTIELVAFETDVDILQYSEKCFEYLRIWLKERNVDFTFFLCKNDFILHNSLVLDNQGSTYEDYDIVIANPPYFKLPKGDVRAQIAKSAIYGQTNIYTIFLLIAAKLLKPKGQLIFITPRSFCSGNYFRLFREIFFTLVELKSIHIFNSRKDAFRRDKVLQENIIITADRKASEQSNTKEQNTLEYFTTISSSFGTEDINAGRTKKYKITELINFDSYQKILYLPLSNVDEDVIRVFKTWSGSLNRYNLEISTGPVVNFRSEDLVKLKKGKNMVPLFWLHNVESMRLVWPRNNGCKGKLKGQYIVKNADSLSKLVKNKNYVLLRRFSTKDDKRRLVASPYLGVSFNNAEMIGIENHLNYIYHKEEELTSVQTIGIAALLNSHLFDLYFRTFNGNINVSATELRDFPLPEMRLIEALGTKIKERQKNGELYDIDLFVSQIFNLSIDLSRKYE
jgi:adenine-specific DNA-methyltransferase